MLKTFFILFLMLFLVNTSLLSKNISYEKDELRLVYIENCWANYNKPFEHTFITHYVSRLELNSVMDKWDFINGIDIPTIDRRLKPDYDKRGSDYQTSLRQVNMTDTSKYDIKYRMLTFIDWEYSGSEMKDFFNSDNKEIYILSSSGYKKYNNIVSKDDANTVVDNCKKSLEDKKVKFLFLDYGIIFLFIFSLFLIYKLYKSFKRNK